MKLHDRPSKRVLAGASETPLLHGRGVGILPEQSTSSIGFARSASMALGSGDHSSKSRRPGDEGGGDWLGLHAIRLTLHNIDGRLPDSPLFSAVFAKFNNDLAELLDWTVNATSTKYATIAPLVIEHVDSQDPHAIHIIKKAAQSVDDIALALNNKVKDTSKVMPCCLFGGIAPFMLPWLGDQLRNRIVDRKYSATEGAIIMIKNHMKKNGLLT